MRTIALLILGSLPFSSSLLAQAAAAVAAAAPTAPGTIATTQQRVDPTMTYHRVMAIVPLVGSGTSIDPSRPMFAPTPQATPSHTGIIAYQHQLSDDGTLSLVEFVAVDRSAFAALFASTNPLVQYFEVGKSTQAQILAAFQQKKASFSLATFHPLSVQ
jgi:hypothetical protein